MSDDIPEENMQVHKVRIIVDMWIKSNNDGSGLEEKIYRLVYDEKDVHDCYCDRSEIQHQQTFIRSQTVNKFYKDLGVKDEDKPRI